MNTPTDQCSPLAKALFDDKLIYTRLVLSASEGLWAILLLWPGITFARPTYEHMALVANEEVWGVLFALSAITQLTIVLRQDYHCTLARYFAAWNAVLWAYVVGSMLMSVYPPPAAISGEIVLAFAAFWIWLRPYILVTWLRKIYARQR